MKHFIFWFVLFCSVLWAQAIKPTPQNVPLCEIQDTIGIIHKGRILYVSDSCVIFWSSNKSYDSSKINDYTIVLPYSNISKINVSKKRSIKYPIGGCLFGSLIGSIIGYNAGKNDEFFGPGIFAALGSLSGGLIGTLAGTITGGIMRIESYAVEGKYENYRTIIPKIKKHTLFPFAPPSELQPFLVE